MDLDYFLKINNAKGANSKKDIQLYNLKAQVNDRFSDTIDCYNVPINGTKQDLLIIRTTDDNKKTIKARPSEDFSVGDVVVWENDNWLVISKDIGNQVYTSGKIQRCNWTLKFQSLTDGSILSYPCITDNKTFNNDENKVITLGDNQKSILCSFNSDTITLTTDKRLYVDRKNLPTPYKIIGDTDTTTWNYGNKGLIYFVVRQDEKQNDDRPDLGICDYVEPTPVPTPVDPTKPTEIVKISCADATNNNVILGLLYTFTATFTNELGNIVTTAKAKYTIDNNYNGLVVLTDKGDGTATIKVDENSYDLLTKQFTLTCDDINNGFTSSVLLTIIGLF